MLTDLTISEARDGLRGKSFTAEELTLAHLHEIEALNPRLNAYL
jgi:aspartyl-tRNA(Asn)/glutamyl-tRNA(Gln) amidotransferase subunit A